jgi:predicted amino acid dehydrogenase
VDSFAFIIHPINPKQDVSRKYPFLGKVVNEDLINYLCAFFPPVYISEIEGIVSENSNKQIKGWFVACPLTPARMLSTPINAVYRKIIQTGQLAEKLGAQILGLGAYTSVVGDGGVTIAERLAIPITTGDAYTISIAIQTIRKAAQIMEIPLHTARVAVIGATGAIGRVCADILADDVGELTLIGRRTNALNELNYNLNNRGCNALIRTSTSMDDLRLVQLMITVTSNIQAIIHHQNLMPGSVICDIARPRDVSKFMAKAQQDILVIDGGMVEVPGNVNYNFDFGFPPGKAYACMAETMALALEGRFEDYTIGKEISRKRVEEITEIAQRHGFRLSGFRSFDQPVCQEKIDKLRTLVKNNNLI